MAHRLWEVRGPSSFALVDRVAGAKVEGGKLTMGWKEGLLPGSPISWGMTFLLFTGPITPLIRYRRRVRSSLRVARAGEETQRWVGEARNGQAGVRHRARCVPERSQQAACRYRLEGKETI